MKILYFLFRNNEQTGPYTADQLFQLALKPSDLIRMDGNSKVWRKVEEIQELKMNLQLLPDSLSNPIVTIDGNKQVEPQIENIINKKDDINSFDKKGVFVSMPVRVEWQSSTKNKSIPQSIPLNIIDKPSIKKEETLKEKVESKANKFLEKELLYFSNLNPVKEAFKTQYSRPLDEIKKEYLTRHKKNIGFSLNRRKAVPVMMVLIVISSTLIIWKSLEHKKSVDKRVAISSEEIKKPVVESTVGNVINNNPRIIAEKAEPVNNKETVNIQTSSTVGTPVKIVKPNEEVSVQEKGEVFSTAEVEDSYKNENNSRQINPPSSSPAEITKAEKPTDNNAAPITAFIDVKGNYVTTGKKGISSLGITLNNKSEALLKLAAVDVFYYAADKSILSRKTIYFSNVRPGAKVTLPAAANNMAVSIDLQLGLVSSAEGNIYYAKH